jgi:hypothetical protein
MHVYDYTEINNPIPSHDSKLSDIRKNKSLYPSVTTILKIIPNPFIDQWRMNKYIELARLFPNDSTDKIVQKAWGYANLPNGQTVPVSEFGTQAHLNLEYMFTGQDDKVSEEWAEFLYDAHYDIINEEKIKPVECEYLIEDHSLRVAGTIDMVAEVDKSYVLVDYKFRNCLNGVGKFYDSDCYQLSIESEFVRNKFSLAKRPKICSVCICNVTGKPFFKWWTQKKLDKSVLIFLDACELYFSIHNLN